MAYNATIELNGNLGADAKLIEKEGKKPFVALRLATTDSYPVKEGDKTEWVDKETIWHDVLIFRPLAIEVAKKFKKGDRVEIKGSFSYKDIEGTDGYKHKEVKIIGSWAAPVEFGKSDEPNEETIAEASEEFTQAA